MFCLSSTLALSFCNLTLSQNDGCTPLDMACQNGHSAVVELLLSRHADVNKATVRVLQSNVIE
ncbi:ankyrin repeat domain-containing protein, partial [Streptococcus pseudopneumoniae]|uniref:ankyrin repeat domain-containing protein n=1 Tax=Streptococcus pseudopneumoniae TaxID=257758 RepID=UPI0019D5CC82